MPIGKSFSMLPIQTCLMPDIPWVNHRTQPAITSCATPGDGALVGLGRWLGEFPLFIRRAAGRRRFPCSNAGHDYSDADADDQQQADSGMSQKLVSRLLIRAMQQ